MPDIMGRRGTTRAKKYNSSRLRDRVLIQTKQKTRDLGQTVYEWVTFIDGLYADVKFESGREFNANDRIGAQLVASIRVRANAAITTDMRVLYGQYVFEINAILLADDRDYMDIAVQAGVAI